MRRDNKSKLWRAYEVLHRFVDGTGHWVSQGHLSVKPGETPFQALCRSMGGDCTMDVCREGDIALSPMGGTDTDDCSHLFWR